MIRDENIIRSKTTGVLYNTSIMSIMKIYVSEKKCILRREIASMLNKVDHSISRKEKIIEIYNLSNFVVKNIDDITIYFSKFIKAFENNFCSLCKEPDFDKGETYYKKLFPKEYEKKYFVGFDQLEPLFKQ
jgi:hypothetical protein